MPGTDTSTASFANHILEAYDACQSEFKKITQKAEKRFQDADWSGFGQDAVERLGLYGHVVEQTVSKIEQMLGDTPHRQPFWRDVKHHFADIVRDRIDYPLAETFFNSITRRVFDIIGVNSDIEFTLADFTVPVIENKPCPVCSAYPPADPVADIHKTILNLLSDFDTRFPFSDKDRDARKVADAIEKGLKRLNISPDAVRIEMSNTVFYRYKGAYMIGRILTGETTVPLVMCLLNIDGAIYVDAVIMDENDVSILFSFAHAYFHADVDDPMEMINFLKSIIPRKRISELFTSLGYYKHGKAELYRELMRSLVDTDDHFEIAPGQQGMVMFVFTIPALDVVFKIIKDRFDHPKQTTREAILKRYDLVFEHDRAGRLVDAQEFDYLQFERFRFPRELQDALFEKADSNISMTDNHVVIKHLYTERRLTPLDLYIRENSPETATDALLDYGWAIKELAASNIFPGDFFFKNFGVTRHGRVVFYDYDELTLLTECNFRRMPKAETLEEEMSAEPWYPIFENDVFPEEFRKFLNFPEYAREPFEQLHGDLFDIAFWREMQKMIQSQTAIHILPYRNDCRLYDAFPESESVFFFRQK